MNPISCYLRLLKEGKNNNNNIELNEIVGTCLQGKEKYKPKLNS